MATATDSGGQSFGPQLIGGLIASCDVGEWGVP
jgi:hypothetical protein